MRVIRCTLGLWALLMLVGCSAWLPDEYQPGLQLKISGRVGLGTFTYSAADRGEVEANQIRNTAMGSILLHQDIKDLYRDALSKEFTQVGIDLNDSRRLLNVEIQEFYLDDQGKIDNWRTIIDYTVEERGRTTYQKVKEFRRSTEKFLDLFTPLNETMRLSIEALLKDPDFLAAIK